MTNTTITRQDGQPILTKLPALESYQLGHPYLKVLGQDSLFDQRHCAWLECAFATLENRATPRDVCWAWSQTADEIIKKVFEKFCDTSNLTVFALGKLGAQELNLSSDIDLLFVCEEFTQETVKQVREVQTFLSQQTALGFLFRCDLDLRPGGKTGPLVPTLEQVVDYYGNYGETWERIALVRCRYVCGSKVIKDELEPFLKRFVYRRHLDFSLFEDLKGLREKIQKAVKTDADSIHLKLAPGGIRDIELFINSLQVIHGGKNPALQITNTDRAFDKILKENILPPGEVTFFKELYWRLRFLENYVQAQDDRQIHSIQKNLTYSEEVKKALDGLEQELGKSSRAVSSLLGQVETPTHEVLDEEFQQILDIPLLSRNKERDQKTREVFVQQFSKALEKTSGDKKLAVSVLKEFVTAVKAKSGLFSLLAREQKLVEDLAWLFGSSPYLARILCQRPELLDSFVYRSLDLQRGDVELLLEQLLEKRLLGEVVEGTEFLKSKDIQSLLNHLSLIADEVVTELLQVIGDHDLKVLSLGKWGGREIGFRSDLDFIFVSSKEADEAGFKSARRLISRLTEPHKGGSLYSIDMRLKPSGKAGPLIVTEESLIDYLATSSQAWERQAYLKARGINWDAKKIRQACYRKSLTQEELGELNSIRQKLIKSSDLDLKYCEGGLLDVELSVQAYLLKENLVAPGPSILDMFRLVPQSANLQKNYLELRTIEQLFHLVVSESESDLNKNPSYPGVLAALFKETDEVFLNDLKRLFAENRKILNHLDPRRTSG